jgi:hypothetical protein
VKSTSRLLLRRPGRLALALTLFFTAGCSSKGTVSGVVKFGGNILPGGRVSFTPEQAGVVGGSSEINPKDGSYRIEGLSTGPMKISVEPYQAPSRPPSGGPPGGMTFGPPKGLTPPPDAGFDPNIFDPNAQAAGARRVEIPAKYRDPETSGLTYTVKGGPQEFDIPLTP